MEEQSREGAPPVYLNVNIRGVVIPTWVALTLSGVAAMAAVVVLLAVIIFKNAADSLILSQATQTKEIRLLDLHVQDVQNVLIRKGYATREDFAKRGQPETQQGGIE